MIISDILYPTPRTLQYFKLKPKTDSSLYIISVNNFHPHKSMTLPPHQPSTISRSDVVPVAVQSFRKKRGCGSRTHGLRLSQRSDLHSQRSDLHSLSKLQVLSFPAHSKQKCGMGIVNTVCAESCFDFSNSMEFSWL